MAANDLNAIVTQRSEVAPGLLVLRVAPDGWELPDFTPGQFAVLGLPARAPRVAGADPDEAPAADPDKLIRRAYSIASSSTARSHLEFYVALVCSGALTPRLFGLPIGGRVFMSPRVSGILTLEDVPYDHHLVLVATGTGIAPYMSMVRTYFDLHSERRFAVIHGAYHSWDLGYRDELATLSRLCPTFAYLPTLSHPQEEPVPWARTRVGFVQSVWTDGTLADAWGFRPTPEDTHVYLCGNPTMIDDMVAMLGREGFSEHTARARAPSTSSASGSDPRAPVALLLPPDPDPHPTRRDRRGIGIGMGNGYRRDGLRPRGPRTAPAPPAPRCRRRRGSRPPRPGAAALGRRTRWPRSTS